ncbi:unnamed protein product [Dibothriocephalus latus]|uniref:Endonuclease/exonuclease/phosphatase domain-containing protein n=1 Tax=Dibothriocephalus latus TaxID=60516 RepID=A0A3P7NH29_DIBLA|nr:unnamed protein product [Dibothriocephalus latus]
MMELPLSKHLGDQPNRFTCLKRNDSRRVFVAFPPASRRLRFATPIPTCAFADRAAPLFQLLLLLPVAGIEVNPGPLWHCSFCQVRHGHGDSSVRCGSYNVVPCLYLLSRVLPFTFSHKNLQVSDFATLPGLKLLQFKAKGLFGKLDLLLAFMRSYRIAEAAIQDKKWTNSTKIPSCADYTLVRRTRSRNKGGDLALLVDKSITHHQLPLHCVEPMEELASSLASYRERLHPPPSSCHSLLTLRRQFGASSQRGQPNTAPSSPDVSLASLRLVASTTWSTETSVRSDHFPIMFEFAITADHIKVPHRHFISLEQADWAAFTTECEAKIDLLPPPTCVHTVD